MEILETIEFSLKNDTLRYCISSPQSAFSLLFNDTRHLPFPLKGISPSTKMLPTRFLDDLLSLGQKDKLSHDLIPEIWQTVIRDNIRNLSNDPRLLLYPLVRMTQPNIVIETGVEHGLSSALILCALHQNEKGMLWSIDLPLRPHGKIDQRFDNIIIDSDNPQSVISPDGKRHVVGQLVPEYLKDRWRLILGDAKEELPKLINKFEEISIFFHDSLHTYGHMLFEFQTVWPKLRKGGFLLSHDIFLNKAFIDFCKSVNHCCLFQKGLGIVRKT